MYVQTQLVHDLYTCISWIWIPLGWHLCKSKPLMESLLQPAVCDKYLVLLI